MTEIHPLFSPSQSPDDDTPSVLRKTVMTLMHSPAVSRHILTSLSVPKCSSCAESGIHHLLSLNDNRTVLLLLEGIMDNEVTPIWMESMPIVLIRINRSQCSFPVAIGQAPDGADEIEHKSSRYLRRVWHMSCDTSSRLCSYRVSSCR